MFSRLACSKTVFDQGCQAMGAGFSGEGAAQSEPETSSTRMDLCNIFFLPVYTDMDRNSDFGHRRSKSRIGYTTSRPE